MRHPWNPCIPVRKRLNSVAVERQVLPLLLASKRFMTATETEALDRVRVQKGVFLLEQRGPQSWRNLYTFRPYDWGPFSRELAADIEDMLLDDLRIVDLEGFRFGEYRTTREGEQRIAEVVETLSEKTLKFVGETRRFVTTSSFSQLLRDVYAAYPEYAVRSRFTG